MEYKNHEIVYVRPSLPFIQEDYPRAIGLAIADQYLRHLVSKSDVWMTDVGPKDIMPTDLASAESSNPGVYRVKVR